MTEQAATVAWLAFMLELDQATRTVNDRFDAMLAEGALPEREKHKPGGIDHDQSRHAGARSHAATTPAKEEQGMIYVNGQQYQAIASYGNTQAANKRLKKVREETGLPVERVRHDGKYWIVMAQQGGPMPPEPPKPKPKPVPKPTTTESDIPEGLRINSGVNHWPEERMLNVGGTGARMTHVSDVMGSLPPEHQRVVKEVGVWNVGRLGKEFAGESYPHSTGGKYVIGQASYTRRDIHVAARQGTLFELSDTVAHEVGHQVLGRRISQIGRNVGLPKKAKTTRSEMGKIYNSKMSKGGKLAGTGFIRKYARTSKEEYIASTYAGYVVNNKTLSRVDPQGWAAMNKFFDGQEYDT